MKWLRRVLILIFFLAFCAMALFFYLPFLNDFKDNGELKIPGLKEPVTIQRDANGMAYIHARNVQDLLMAQGFVTAQDRLFQMQLTRLVIQGRVCELAGPGARNFDIRMRTIGLNRMAKKQTEILNGETKKKFQSYVDGINAFIENCPDDIHLEFKLAGIQPEKWEVADSVGILYYMGYSTAANLNTEIVAQTLLETLDYEKVSQIMPLNINADDPKDTGMLKIPAKSDLLASMSRIQSLAAYATDRKLRAGSNNWAVSPARSTSGSAILAGDPHLDPRILPGVWYPIGLIAPDIRAVGVHIPGIPGMAIGRTDYIALSATNNYGDMLDLYIETIDSKNPNHYLEGKISIPFTRIEETLRIKDKDDPTGFKTENITILTTRRGPVVSGIFPDLNTSKTISMRFAPAESMGSTIGLFDILTAKNNQDVVNALKNVPMGCLNWVFADADGNIGHQASGKIPIRYNGDGTFPHLIKDNTDNWHGWIPQDEMPGSMNPDKNWIGTCNQKTIDHDYPYYYSSYFAPSYRYRRLKELMASSDKKSSQDLWDYQRDTKNLLAQNISPIMAKVFQSHEETRVMGKIIAEWDFRDDPNKAAPAIFQATYRHFAYLVFEDELGQDNAMVMLNNWYFWQERLEQMVLRNEGAWFDNIKTLDQIETREDLFFLAGLEAKKVLSGQMGNSPEKWQWGQVHTLELVNPLRRTEPGKALLGSGLLPMGGSGETLYRGWYDYDKPFEITHCAALRMVTDFSDKDKILAVMPGGVSGRSFYPHQKDQIKAYMSGEKRYWWFSDKAIDDNTKSRLMLTP
ncbi:MAG: penicillin acylase family protein [Deltaproteobacteria bacterium]|uniref:penicillin acylase family protein n=1 Tax=Desulfobacula sp. TaxID=2593537 RepID=UPI001985286D|nr:penicillin acylase family protein [Candidatus Desulfobacula maris]MBL6995314.1 penicillin acylase family protein [Desulfobacula sp.]